MAIPKKGAHVDINFDFDPNPRILASSLWAAEADIRSFREPLKRAIQGVMAPSFRQNFEAGGRPDEWAPLADSTVARKRAKGAASPEQILVDTGKLQRVAGQLNIWTINGPAGEAYVSQLPGAEYGEFHSTGTQHMPQREFLVIQEDDQDEIEQVFDIWLRERFARHGWFIA